jgi:sugar O-acyltransferase (sialic acid O-acetyltransferase NeuD family)
MPSDSFLIWGGGGHGKVVADIIRAAGCTVVGFADRDPAKLHRIVEPGGASVVISEADLLALLAGSGALSDVEGATAIALGIGDNVSRITSLRHAPDVSISTLVHPSAIVSASSVLGRGTVVFPLAVINAAARVGEGVIVNSGAIIEHDCVVGDGAHVAPGSVLTGGVHVGARTTVGAGATVLPGIRIGSDAIVGAGAVVTRDVPDHATVAGNPAKPMNGARAASVQRG